MKSLFRGNRQNNNSTMKANYNNYRIEIKKSALKELSQIPQPYNKKIEAIDELAVNPRPADCKRLKGSEGLQN